jgi:hypothetical protein
MNKNNFSYSADKARKAKIKKILSSKKLKYGVALFTISIIITSAMTIALSAREESICKTESEKIFKEIFSEWEDTSRRANNTGRIALAPVVGEMQAIKRKTEKIEIPSCAVFAKFSTVQYMNVEINLFLKFMADKSITEPGFADINKKIAVEEIAFIQMNGKSNYKFNSESEMTIKYWELMTKLFEKRTNELLGEGTDKNVN